MDTPIGVPWKLPPRSALSPTASMSVHGIDLALDGVRGIANRLHLIIRSRGNNADWNNETSDPNSKFQ